MARCTAPVRGHRTASARAECPACGGRGGYGGYSSYRSYSPPSYSSPYYSSSGSSGGGRSSGGGSSRSTKPRWSGVGSSQFYTPEEVRALTPMRDSSVVRLMQRQTQHKVTLLPLQVVREGMSSVNDALNKAEAAGYRYVVVDAVCNSDLETLGAALANEAFITGGSGIASGLPDNFRSAGLLTGVAKEGQCFAPPGRGALIGHLMCTISSIFLQMLDFVDHT
jgi:hypothetical protein